jgi:DNA-binding MarR family transcriptional regulator
VRTTSVTDLASHLRLGITRTARRLRQESGTDLSPSLRSALATIERHGPLTPSELAHREAVKRPTVTRVVTRLEEAGLVERAADAVDRRSFLVTVTPAGQAFLQTDRARKDSFLARRLEALDDDDRLTLERASALLERLLDDRRDDA